MKQVAVPTVAVPTVERGLFFPIVLALFLLASTLASQAQNQQKYPGRGGLISGLRQIDLAAGDGNQRRRPGLRPVSNRFDDLGSTPAPGTAKGSYMVVVTGSAGSGSSQYQTSVNVPITIQ